MLTGEGREERGEKAERAGRSNKNFVRIVELILALGLLLASVHEGICATTALLGRRAEHLGQTERALRWYRWSSGEWFARDLPLALTRLTLRAGAPDQALQKVTRYTEEENPYDARGWRIQGEVLSASGRTVEAIEALSRAYELGRFTDLSITRELIQELGEQGGVETLLPRKQEFDALLRQYYDAILRNSHYVALSPNVEEFLRVSELLSELFPADEPRYQVMAAGVDRQAKMERLRLSALRQQL
jgi:tetratricopeptide (TPR) repeat protein